MLNAKSRSEAEILDRYKLSIFNALQLPEIATELAEVGYTTEKMAEGNSLLTKTLDAVQTNTTENNERIEVYADFTAKKDELNQRFLVDRKKVKVVFRKDPVTLEKTAAEKIPPRAHSKWIEHVKKFYSAINADEAIKAKLATLMLTQEKLDEVLTLIEEAEYLKTRHYQEIAQSEEATQSKNQALDELEEWMQDFYVVAGIALSDKPQLQEAFGKTIKS